MTPKEKKKPRILLIADVPNWIFARHCQTISRLLSDEFEFKTIMWTDSYREKDYDLIYALSFDLPIKIKNPAKYITGIRSHRSWRGEDFSSIVQNLTSNFQRVHVVSRRLYDMFEPFVPGLTYVSHGVDTEFFKPTNKGSNSGMGKLNLGWAGKRSNPVKGFERFVEPLGNIKGVNLKTCGFDAKNLDINGMYQFYNEIDAYVCTSFSEGHNNPLSEAGAMKKAIITTNVGVVPECFENGISALIVEQEVPSLIRAVIELRDNPALRLRLGTNARKAIVDKFDWNYVIGDYRKLFKSAIKNSSDWKPRQSALIKNINSSSLKKLPKAYDPEALTTIINRRNLRIKELEKENKKLKANQVNIMSSKTWKYMHLIARVKALARVRSNS